MWDWKGWGGVAAMSDSDDTADHSNDPPSPHCAQTLIFENIFCFSIFFTLVWRIFASICSHFQVEEIIPVLYLGNGGNQHLQLYCSNCYCNCNYCQCDFEHHHQHCRSTSAEALFNSLGLGGFKLLWELLPPCKKDSSAISTFFHFRSGIPWSVLSFFSIVTFSEQWSLSLLVTMVMLILFIYHQLYCFYIYFYIIIAAILLDRLPIEVTLCLDSIVHCHCSVIMTFYQLMVFPLPLPFSSFVQHFALGLKFKFCAKYWGNDEKGIYMVIQKWAKL